MNAQDIVKTRKKQGLTQDELAGILGVSKNTIYNWENGSKIPASKITILTKWAKDSLINHNIKTDSKSQKFKSDVELSNTDDEIEIFTNKNGIKFYEYPDGSTKIEVIKVPFDAYASYLEAYNDDEKLHSEFSTATFTVDKVAKGNYLAFNIKNNSMNGGGIDDTPSGAEVLAREIGRHLWCNGFHKNKYGFILMTKNAIYHKDIGDCNNETGLLTLHSRNKSDDPFEIHMNDIYRIFNVIKRTF
ncbi:helix-turn-helix domain-containing protein [Flavobacterium cupreum]|uniref:Helix-turn-helix domain-containing protein n=1 Tax=Flavobacterium cupreum TaxID=2133766 RepID=A0A434A2K9_9FLAO|nr:helix-turn-helix domain-containing protein [Flavobacterium cupreum]RUT68639.1 helix-turn-helix domain-containing protein [Flavobacterium cupreum]